MSAELFLTSEPGGTNAGLQGTTVGGSKPLHRFIKGQPKAVGIMVLVLGLSFVIVSITIRPNDSSHYLWTTIPPGFILGSLFIICGILYMVTEHSPTKKTVTISLALSIVNILVACWTVMHILPEVVHAEIYLPDNDTYSSYSFEVMGFSVELIFLFYSIVGAVTLIVMSCLAVSALRSTKSEAIIVMTATQAETPVE
ncbi:hypothetical protein PBY51_018785 [Eleginops maclovinus]|uniref:Uncharacterized protein n=1 Tax=Eleginops maclovinus TaxID=56733 RepID=A0AAN7Y8M3_ELEMC|nr:hypothetical protein PBY51_018785 [Eleginops maclovinus]